MRLDIGASDDVSRGDVYVVMVEGSYKPFARIKITEVDKLFAWAVVLDRYDDTLRPGQEATYTAGEGELAPVTIVVVSFAAAILGMTAYSAQRYWDAMFYLALALGKDVLSGEDALRGLRELSYAMYVRGQTVGARAQANMLVERARKERQAGWEMAGHAELARVAMREGNVEEARKLLVTIERWAESQGYYGEWSYALHQEAMLEAQQGQVDEARELYARSLVLKRRIGDVQGEAATLHQQGILGARQGRTERARELYARSLELERRIGDVAGEARTLHQQAILEAQEGHVDKAKELYARSLELKRRIGDVQGEAATRSRALARVWATTSRGRRRSGTRRRGAKIAILI